MIFPAFRRAIDERFLLHRLRSTSIAGVTAGILATVLFAYHYYHDHVWNWELLSIGLTMAVIKIAMMAYYRITD